MRLIAALGSTRGVSASGADSDYPQIRNFLDILRRGMDNGDESHWLCVDVAFVVHL